MTEGDIRNRMKFTGVYNGARYWFQAVEHVNIGEGWMCRELDRRLPPGVYVSGELSDLAPDAEGAEA